MNFIVGQRTLHLGTRRLSYLSGQLLSVVEVDKIEAILHSSMFVALS